MKKYNLLCLVIMMVASFFCSYGMEAEKKLSMIERKVTTRALSQLAFTKNDKVLHIGPPCTEMILKKAEEMQVYSIDAKTLAMLNTPREGLVYDKVLTFACWDVAKKPYDTFVHSARLLKPRGKFCAVLPYDRSPFINIYHQTFINDTWKKFYDINKETKLCGSRKIKKLLADAGLGDFSVCKIIKRPFLFKTKEKFMEWLVSYASELDGIIPQERHEEFLNDVVTNYLQEYPLGKDNSIKLYLPYMIVSGYKS